MQAYLARIHEVNLNGPGLRAIIETNPYAVDQANALDVDRRKCGSRGRLHGIPIVLKDSIATKYEDFGSAILIFPNTPVFITL
jgi:amidase